jgi:hypothetical protein
LALQEEENPLDADLERVLPGVHERLHANHHSNNQNYQAVSNKLDCVMETVVTGFETMATGFSQVLQHTSMYVQETDKLVGASLVNAGRHLINTNRNFSSPVQASAPGQWSPARSPNSTTGTVNTTQGVQLREQLPTALPTNAVHSEEEHSMYRLQSKHSDLASIWDQWLGEGIFANEYGGINGRNQLHEAKWRRHIDKTEYSRHN